MKQRRDDPNNERIARAIIMSNTTTLQRANLPWLVDLEHAIVKALDMKESNVNPTVGEKP